MGDTLSSRSLLQGLQRSDPKLYQAFQYLFDNVDKINNELFPNVANITALLASVEPGTVSGFNYELLPRSVRFYWDDANDAQRFEIRRGTNWDTADFVLRTSSLTASIDPLVAGDYTHLIKSISSSGDYSTQATVLEFNIQGPGVVSITSTVIDNNVLLYWRKPTHPFDIVHYNVYREGVEIGEARGTFFNWFENIAGNYTYGIQAVDYAGNEGAITSVLLTVNQPPDYVLESLFASVFGGTLTNCILEGGKLLAMVNTADTWADHFVNNGWTTIQEQIDDGYPLYIQPTPTTGNYEEVKDYGAIFSSVIISVAWTEEIISGSVGTVCKIATSTDNITYTAFTTTNALFSSSVRYVKVKLEFSGTDSSLSLFNNLTIALNVKREMDGGVEDVLAADTAGTVVSFNKSFKDIESITLTALSTTEQIAIYNFVDTPNPTDFKILLFDATGARVDGTVSWKARGIL